MNYYGKAVGVMIAVLIIVLVQIPLGEAQMQDYIDERIRQKETLTEEDVSDTVEKDRADELREEFADDAALLRQRREMRQMQRMNMMNRGRE